MEDVVMVLIFKVPMCLDALIGKQWCRHSLIPRLSYQSWSNGKYPENKMDLSHHILRWENKYISNVLSHTLKKCKLCFKKLAYKEEKANYNIWQIAVYSFCL